MYGSEVPVTHTALVGGCFGGCSCGMGRGEEEGKRPVRECFCSVLSCCSPTDLVLPLCNSSLCLQLKQVDVSTKPKIFLLLKFMLANKV